MSHVAKMQTSITDPKALVEALKKCGIAQARIEVHDKAIQCQGYHAEEKFMANVVVRRKEGAWGGSDIGWERGQDGRYVAHLDDYNYSANGQHYSEAWQTNLYTHYNIEKVRMELESRGLEYVEERDTLGRTQFRAKIPLQDDRNRERTGR